jgi:hypothetical protein
MQQTYNKADSFHEVQQFRQPWLWLVLLATTITVASVFIHGFYIQLYLGHPWGDKPMPDTMLVIVGAFSVLLTAGLTFLFYNLKLITDVNSDGIHLRFFPLTSKTVQYEDITSCRARSYRPIREYGGWGIRFGPNGKAYNVFGNRGVQLEFSNATPLLIGSQRPEDLAAVINRHIEDGEPD